MKKILLLSCLLLASHLAISQGTFTSNAVSGNWSASGSWTLTGGSDTDGVPDADDTVTIASGHTITVDATAAAAGLTVNQQLNVENDLTISGNVVNAGILEIDGGNLTISGTNSTLSNTQQIHVRAGYYLRMSGTSSSFTNSATLRTYATSTSMGRIILYGSFSESGFPAESFARYINDTGDAGTSTGWDLIGVPITNLTVSEFIGDNPGDIATYDPDGNSDDNDTYYGVGIYDPTDSDWETFTGPNGVNPYGSTSFTLGKGYQMATGSGSVVEFKGTLNTSNVNISLTSYDADGDGGSNGSRWNIVSNPFLSYIHANDNNGGTNVLTLNSSILHSSNVALYFWDGDSYAALNHSSSASTYDYIAPFQGFLVATSYNSGNAQTFSFTKAMQTTAGSDDAILNDVMDDGDGELHFTINQNGFNRKTELYFNENGSDGLDLGYDAAAFSTMNTYLSTRLVDDSANEGENFSIQTLSIDDMWQKTIPLVVNALGSEEMTIGISHRTTPADLNIYLEDTEEGTMTNLLEGDFVYTPTSDLSGVGRFFIHMTADTMSNEDVSTSMLNAYKEVDASYITIEGLATQTNETNVSLYNILGREVLSTTLNNNMNTQTISTIGLSAGIYVIELESGTDRLTKKLLIQ